MDQYLATVVVAIITGIFSVVTIIVQKRQDKEITKLNDDTAFMDKENEVRKRLLLKEKEREQLMHEVMIFVLETNLLILKTQQEASGVTDDKYLKQFKQMHDRFTDLTNNITEISKEYNLVLEMTAQLRNELKSRKGKK